MTFKKAAAAAAIAAALLGAYALGQTASAQSSPPPRIVGYMGNFSGQAQVLLQYSDGTFRHCSSGSVYPSSTFRGRDGWVCINLAGIPAR